jgi:hypothetical protein
MDVGLNVCIKKDFSWGECGSTDSTSLQRLNNTENRGSYLVHVQM